jgi:hypothetical protein
VSLYAGFDAKEVRDPLGPHTVLVDQEVTSESSGKTIHRLIVRIPG